MLNIKLELLKFTSMQCIFKLALRIQSEKKENKRLMIHGFFTLNLCLYSITNLYAHMGNTEKTFYFVL